LTLAKAGGAGGNLTVTAGGAITDTATLEIAGVTTLEAGSGNDITLNTSTNNFADAVVITSGKDVTLVDEDAIDLGASTVSGIYHVTATAGGISNSGNLVITGAATFITTAADSNIILGQSGNAFASTVTMKAGDGTDEDFNNITFVDTNAIRLHTSAASAGDLYINAETDGAVGGALSVTATNADITQTVALDVTGTTTLAAGSSNDITLNTSTNNFADAVVITSGRNVAITDEDTIVLGAATVSGTYNVTATTGGITDSGTQEITGVTTLVAGSGNDITLNTSTNNFAAAVVITSGRNVAIIDENAIDLGAATVSGTYNVTATTGGITDSGTQEIAGVTTLAAGSGNDITLNTSTNNFAAAVVVTSGKDVTLVDEDAIDLGASTVSGTYAVTATAGGISNSGNLVITGAATFITTAADSNIILGQSGNAFASTVTMKAGDGTDEDFNNITFVDTNAIRLHTSAASAGDLYINAETDGAVGGALSVTATNADITQTVALDVTGTTTLAAGSSNDITLNTSTNNFATVVITSGRNVAIIDEHTIVLGAATVSGTYAVTATTGGITDSDTQEIAGVTTLAAGSTNDITLNTSTNNFAAAVVVTSGRNVAIIDENAIDLGASTVSGTYAVTATAGGISNSGNLVITGAATFITTAADSNIILGESGNAFASTVTMKAGDGTDEDFNNITFVDTNAIRLHTSAASAGDLYINAETDGAVGGALSVTATNADITQTVALDVTGTTTLAAGSSNDITLGNRLMTLPR